jgi:imidazolonepropionase-like amidohydrolase
MEANRGLLVTSATLFDGTGVPPRGPATILIRGGRIEAVTTGAAPAAAGAAVIDARGKWVIPGLIDMHVHVALSGGEDALLAWLAMGVTTIRDVGGDMDVLLDLRDAVARGEKTGCRIVSYGPMLDGVPPIFAGRRGPAVLPAGNLTRVLADAAEAEAACDDLLARGVEGFKLYAGLRPDIVRAFIRRVDGRVPVTGHLGRTWASEAIEAGINCLEHVHATLYQDVARPEDRHGREDGNGVMPNYWTWLNEGWARADLEADHVKRVIELLVSRGVTLSPTTVLVTGGMATREALDEPGLKYTPRAMAERRRQQAEAMRQAREEAERAGTPLPPVPQVDPAVGERALENELRFLRMVHEAGGTVVPSTDCGAAPNQVPGFSLHRELALFVRAGIPPAKVLALATGVAARVMRKEDDYGTLTPGKRADLLLLSADPLSDINHTREIEIVVKDGVVYQPQPLLDQVLAGTTG